MNTLRLDASRFNAVLTRFKRELGQDFPATIKEEARRFLGLVIQFTPPKTGAQGNRAVKRDINRALALIEPRQYKNRELQRIIRERDYAAWDSVMQRSKFFKGKRAGWELVRFDEGYHTRARNRRGRVTRTQKKWTLDAFQLKGYVRRVQARVGRMKAGWLPAFDTVGGTGAPPLVTKHRGTRPPGYVIDGLRESSPSLTIANAAKGITADEDTVRRVRDALRIRAKNMEKNLRRQIRERAERSGLK